MPCNMMEGVTSADIAVGDHEKRLEKLEKQIVPEANRVTRYLCGILSAMESEQDFDNWLSFIEADTDGVEPGEIDNWWREHKAKDAANP